ncbi:leucyl/phenylalanyl-tRNA--protein transferase [Maridesulfovibrio salexigens]|uniref:Leucyl/phenylalanyl-tRNA--protein transferase n=1 Tax=Maridesulfovibrio salexigens (strain ATCC 14822 / DSM 2638 / NCIMB 8403 / VKM B-1763) TaxID=526222 RepID=LFTR_MARSD|nr:leucyl/phenylalanyl-tRNA--protein transferase [Maridesulfovibrio salexigens]C6BTW3.1 RecName: Full=Leucyl/phenylalanyl-tRNA--protein transferase; AltName: Full=L/F-transferase; AltName: Full=Leucyltransferase; AltName: Full=Phenyalanyltransferase [Maridesulfovibrio salexigens DSM 2638]ACS79893.1 leucyl/phenylalanyl-tRNA/protein transferase [Maridesulfovibrio salexigens DSM 2638]
MVVYRLIEDPIFPHPDEAEPDGLLAVGGDLSPERLLSAYASGIFPWYDERSPILWWSLDPRLILNFDKLHVSRRVKRKVRKREYTVTFDRAFESVIANCARKFRPGQAGTWILPEMIEAYVKLHKLGFVHSVEVWNREGNLAGGLYGVSLGKVFSGESMFFLEPDASKVGFSYLVQWLKNREFHFVDCQQPTDHLKSLGAEEVSRELFLDMLDEALEHPALRGTWEFMEGEYEMITEVLS